MAASVLGGVLARWPTMASSWEPKDGTTVSFREMAMALLLWNSIGGMVYLTGVIRWRQIAQVVMGWWRRNSSQGSLGNLCSGLAVTMVASALWWSCRKLLRWMHDIRQIKTVEESVKEPSGDAVSEKDLEDFKNKAFQTAGKGWEKIVDKGEGSVIYTAWRIGQSAGPTLYLSRTVLEGISASTMREFYLDDKYRNNWDPCHSESTVLQKHGGCNFVRWIRKYPCVSPREYIIARRNWEEDGALYTITKSAEHPAAVDPPRGMRRVNSFYSSWCVREVESELRPGTKATEVILLHAEDLGVSESLARFVIRQGLWTFVKKMTPAVNEYHRRRMDEAGELDTRCGAGERASKLSQAPVAGRRKVLVSAVGAAAVASGVGVPLAGATYLAALAVAGQARGKRS
mmetsp:Transcript_11070/g.68160  ORF Transcript_11070/g.68160 Transcript_11070/m.68160 type:complete len:401 (+) Transcript_11070:131-1333(+)